MRGPRPLAHHGVLPAQTGCRGSVIAPDLDVKVGDLSYRSLYLHPDTSGWNLAVTLPWTPVLAGMAPVTRGVRFRVSHAQHQGRGEVPETSSIPTL